VRGIARDAHAVRVRCDHGVERYDQVVLACHADEALALLDDPGQREREILGAIAFQANDTVLHTDAALLPRNRKAWAAWNAHVPADPTQGCTVSYCMNLLEGLGTAKPLVVTLNRTDDIDPATVLVRRSYRHPVYTHAMVAAQARKHEIQGMDRTWFAGAYWGWGFHEDGMRSGVEVAGALGVAWPEAAVASAHCDQSPRVAA
jgi:predicted NAD/FAD-binding protein